MKKSIAAVATAAFLMAGALGTTGIASAKTTQPGGNTHKCRDGRNPATEARVAVKSKPSPAPGCPVVN